MDKKKTQIPATARKTVETTIIPVARETTDRRMTETMTEAGREIITVIREIETITIVRTETETTAVHRTTETITAGRTVSVKSRQQLQHRKKSAERTPVEIMTAAITTIIIGKIMINSAERNRKIM